MDRRQVTLGSWLSSGPRVGGWLTWMFLAGAVVFSLARTVGKGEDFQDADFGAYYQAGRMVSLGESPYTILKRVDASFVYSPACAYLFLPLQSLGYLPACQLWTLVNWGSCLACIVLALHLTFGADWRHKAAWGLLWLALLPVVSYFWNNVRSGQVGALMAACCLAWAVCRRRGRPFLGGLFLAAACALKITPVLLLPYLVLRRDWRGLSGALAGGAALILLPACWVGWPGVVTLHRDWASHTLHTQVPSQTIRPTNQSFLGQLARLPGVSNGGKFSADALEAVQRCYPWLVLALTAAAYLAVGWNSRGRGSPPAAARDCSGENLHLSLLFILITLVNPRAWTCNFVVLLLPCLLLARAVWRRQPGSTIALVPLALMTLASIVSTSYPEGHQWSWLVWLNQGRHFWSAVATGLACSWLHLCSRGANPECHSGT